MAALRTVIVGVDGSRALVRGAACPVVVSPRLDDRTNQRRDAA